MIYIIDEILIDPKKYKNLSIQPLTETKNIYFYISLKERLYYSGIRTYACLMVENFVDI